MKKINTKQGFTIIELLVVATLIALISTVVLGSLGTAKAKARDSERITEMQNIQKALELSYITTGSYPVADPINDNGAGQNNPDKTKTSMSSILGALVTSKSITSIPFPPAQGSAIDSSYYYRTSNPTSVVETYQCDGKDLGGSGLPYILYFYTELPQKLPVLTKNGITSTINGYCFTNS